MRFPRPRFQTWMVLVIIAALAGLYALSLQISRVTEEPRRTRTDRHSEQSQRVIDEKVEDIKRSRQTVQHTREAIKQSDAEIEKLKRELAEVRRALREREREAAEKAKELVAKQDVADVRNYVGEDEPPRDAAAEKRRDYAVLEAALNDLASPKNPEHITRIANAGLGKEVVINIKTEVGPNDKDDFLRSDRLTRTIDNEAARGVLRDVRDGFQRKSQGAAGSLADFKPANPSVVVEDMDRMLEKPQGLFDDTLGAIRRKYPKAWDYVWAHNPAYSKEGNSAAVVFYSPVGPHGGDWVYLLSKKRSRWEVIWRQMHIYK